ncbi:MAG: bifunctional 23S rRNA (guanine(2069)-N(7))-methyltransferase RlmK/23S rRNA (guanine(2445)-N(2))-methyltransferase RlmL [Planctomycetales bacterium]|nr:bifunctional 23S rRNA (guanine(2069)-N(7))-methyltransferase RlmK/23S rRNA (guanine(2445)-N(2))-methyltransferase RlmL [Planctomycetales bacterium]
MPFQLVATAAFGLEAVVVRELEQLGYTPKITRPGRIEFAGDRAAICRANLWLRSADRVLIQLAKFPATDFDALFDTAGSLPWEEWIAAEAAIPVRGRSHKSQLTSVPACQRTVKKAIVERLLRCHGVGELPETGPPVSVEVAILDDEATLSIDTSGAGLHKRGYRTLAAQAQLRETLAAALVQLSFWKPGRPLIDPFCGSGTIVIEAALIGRNLAPGRLRDFAAEHWPAFPAQAWAAARQEAGELALPALDERLLGTDIDPAALSLARYHAERAGVADDLHFQQRAFADLLSKRQYGCTIMNPPYGLRMGENREIEELYRQLPQVLRRLKTWSHYILSARDDLEQLVGQKADRRRKLYNAQIECTYYQFYGPRPPRPQTSAASSAAPSPSPNQPPTSAPPKSSPIQTAAFGGLRPEAARQAEEFANRLRKLARHLRRWPTKRGITCYRIYDRDIPEIPLVVDRYEDALHIAEYQRPHERTAAEHADWLDHMVRTACAALDTPRELAFVKHRARQRGNTQYERVDDQRALRVVSEGGLKFQVNLSDYIDTGLFLDHRITRSLVRDAATGKNFLNLFAYTGAFTVYAAAGGAAKTTSVDLSPTYVQWAEDNLRLNGFTGKEHRLVCRDVQEFLTSSSEIEKYDLAIVDPPTFSNSKRLDDDWDVQQHFVPLLQQVIAKLTPGGVVYFSTNSRRFKLDETALAGGTIREITRQTVPEDYRNKKIHRCWRMVVT